MKNTLLLFILLFPFFSAQADEPNFDPKGTWWINVGGGPAGLISGTVDTDEADNTKTTGVASASFNYALFSNQFIEVRASKTGSFLGFLDLSCLFDCDEQLNKLKEVGVLYGVMKKTKWYTVGAAGGLAYTELEYKGGERVYVPDGNYYTTEHTYRNSQTIGVPLEAQFFFTPFKYVGIGLVGLGNLNTEGSMLGGMLALQVGKLRP